MAASQGENDAESTPRVKLWRALCEGEAHSLGSLAQSAGLSAKEVRHHLEHVAKQARTLKNKSADWRSRREIPAHWDPSSVRVQIIPASCDSCGWEADRAAQRAASVKVCKKCGARSMSPVLVQLKFRSN